MSRIGRHGEIVVFSGWRCTAVSSSCGYGHHSGHHIWWNIMPKDDALTRRRYILPLPRSVCLVRICRVLEGENISQLDFRTSPVRVNRPPNNEFRLRLITQDTPRMERTLMLRQENSNMRHSGCCVCARINCIDAFVSRIWSYGRYIYIYM